LDVAQNLKTMSSSAESNNTGFHLRIAEYGKILQLNGDYKNALRHYKEALKMAQNSGASEIFFQHYSQCVMESLELSGSHQEVISYCEKYREFLGEKDQELPLIIKHFASILEKEAIQYLFLNEPEEALELLKAAQEKIGRGKQKIADALLSWLQKGFQISRSQIIALQKKHEYFIVRAENINNAIAMELPAAVGAF